MWKISGLLTLYFFNTASTDVGLFFDAFQNLFFSLQYSLGPTMATIVSLRHTRSDSDKLIHDSPYRLYARSLSISAPFLWSLSLFALCHSL
ncbi:hypothetical protein Zmor_021171 [Zophobas morio]|uniref:Secreted protein n=1 Tax=Zophobas morio TaxID=2755281 RepID=A0AA38I584_9CUCU|nr:hypothetical protein Zmor_021171 [Zophobas morio]